MAHLLCEICVCAVALGWIGFWQQNNYDKDVFNGDVGVIEELDLTSKTVTVRFTASQLLVQYTQREADQLSLAWAITVRCVRCCGFRHYSFVICLVNTLGAQGTRQRIQRGSASGAASPLRPADKEPLLHRLNTCYQASVDLRL